jgi:hypothetical protein
VTAGWRKLHNEELHDLYSSPSIIRMIKSRRMRWAGHVARTGIIVPVALLEMSSILINIGLFYDFKNVRVGSVYWDGNVFD